MDFNLIQQAAFKHQKLSSVPSLSPKSQAKLLDLCEQELLEAMRNRRLVKGDVIELLLWKGDLSKEEKVYCSISRVQRSLPEGWICSRENWSHFWIHKVLSAEDIKSIETVLGSSPLTKWQKFKNWFKF